MYTTECLTVPTDVPDICVRLARVTLQSSAERPWLFDDSVVRHFDVLTPKRGHKIGKIDINYDYANRLAHPHPELDIQKNGIGTEIYLAIPFVPLPSGESFLDSGFKLRTDRHNDAANALWESLTRKNLAVPLDGERRYEILPDIPAPTHLEVVEL